MTILYKNIDDKKSMTALQLNDHIITQLSIIQHVIEIIAAQDNLHAYKDEVPAGLRELNYTSTHTLGEIARDLLAVINKAKAGVGDLYDKSANPLNSSISAKKKHL